MPLNLRAAGMAVGSLISGAGGFWVSVVTLGGFAPAVGQPPGGDGFHPPPPTLGTLPGASSDLSTQPENKDVLFGFTWLLRWGVAPVRFNLADSSVAKVSQRCGYLAAVL